MKKHLNYVVLLIKHIILPEYCTLSTFPYMILYIFVLHSVGCVTRSSTAVTLTIEINIGLRQKVYVSVDQNDYHLICSLA